ncbi:hypothetical protein NWF32_03290 [Pseudomonas qingdaonensis]|nr:hypothetical protein [Pseudomonas qingdaonensis]
MSLASLGYVTALFRDSDQALKAGVAAALQAQNVQVFEYGSLHCTELAVFEACWPDMMDKLIQAAIASLGEATIFAQLRPEFPNVNVAAPFATWLPSIPGTDANWLRVPSFQSTSSGLSPRSVDGVYPSSSIRSCSRASLLTFLAVSMG